MTPRFLIQTSAWPNRTVIGSSNPSMGGELGGGFLPLSGGHITGGFSVTGAVTLVGTVNISTGPLIIATNSHISLVEKSSGPSGVANQGQLYCDDTGGKTQLMVIFGSGSAIQIAVEA